MLIVRFRHSFRERFAEWALSMMLASWGFTVLGSPGLFERPFYGALVNIAPQGAWGTLALLIGIGRLVVLFINGAWRQSPLFRQVGAVFGMLVWVMLTMGALSLGWRSPSVAIYLGLFTLDAFNMSFAARDAAISQRGGAGNGNG